MSEKQARPPAVLVVLGASGAGKTTLVRQLEALALPGVGCYFFDSIGVPSDEEMVARFSTGQGWQQWALDQWIARLAQNDDGVALAVLDGQVTPTAVRDAFIRYGIEPGRTVLVDCDTDERNARLRGSRQQPELANPRMDNWAAYLRGQADALGIPVLDTTGTSPSEGVLRLQEHVSALLQRRGRA